MTDQKTDATKPCEYEQITEVYSRNTQTTAGEKILLYRIEDCRIVDCPYPERPCKFREK